MRGAFPGLWLVAVAAPLAWSDAVVAEYALPKLLFIALGALAAATGACRFPLRPTPLDAPLTAWILALGAATLASSDVLYSLLGEYNNYAYGFLAAVLYACAYLLAAGALDDLGRRRLADWAVMAGGLIGLYGALQWAGIEPFRLSAPLESLQGRVVSTIGSPVHLGGYLAMLLPLALQRALRERGRRPLWMACLALMGAALAATLSRGAWLSAALGLGAYLALGELRPERGKGLRFAAFSLAAVLAVGIFMTRRLAVRSHMGAGDVQRLEGWRVAWSAFREHPWLGTGPETYGLYFRRHRSEAFIRAASSRHLHVHAHNDLLHALATTGLLGTLAYLWGVIALARAALAALGGPRRDEAAALSAALLALFANMKFNPMSIETLAVAALLAGALCPARVSKDGARARAWLFVGLSLAACIVCLRLCAADRHAQLARVALGRGHSEDALRHIRGALAANACEIKYGIILANELVDRIRASLGAGPAAAPEREAWAIQASETGRRVVACHPNDPAAHYIHGFVSLVRAQLGSREALTVAEGALDRAVQLDPTFLPLLELRLEAAKARGDEGVAAAIRARIQSIRAINSP